MADGTFYPPTKFGDSSAKTDKDIEMGCISGRGIKNLYAHLLRMSQPMFIPNLVTLAQTEKDIEVGGISGHPKH